MTNSPLLRREIIVIQLPDDYRCIVSEQPRSSGDWMWCASPPITLALFERLLAIVSKTSISYSERLVTDSGIKPLGSVLRLTRQRAEDPYIPASLPIRIALSGQSIDPYFDERAKKFRDLIKSEMLDLMKPSHLQTYVRQLENEDAYRYGGHDIEIGAHWLCGASAAGVLLQKHGRTHA